MSSNRHSKKDLFWIRFGKTSAVFLTCLLAIGLTVTILMIASATTPASVSADNGSDTASTDVTLNLVDSISIRTLDSARTTEIESLDMELTPTPSGRFIKDTTVVDVSTSNPSGYMLYMSSEYTDPRTSSPSTPVYTTDMINHDTNINDTVANLTNTNVSEAAFSAANTITSGTNSNPNINHWGYSLTENNVAGTYNPIPAYNASQTIRNDVVSAVEHSYTPVTIGVNVDTNIASGTYTNNLVFSTIVNPPYVDYSLLFNANTDGAGGDDGSVSNLPTDIEERVMATSYTVTIPSTAPERSNYVFSGYNTKADGTGTTYQPGDTYTLTVDDVQSFQTESTTNTIYAMWEQYTYSVVYDCDSGTGCPVGYSLTTTDDSISYTIPTSNLAKSGFSFAGYLGSDNNTYQAGDTVTLTKTGNSFALVAQWIKDFWTIQYMQDMTPEICSTATTPTSSATSYDTDGSHRGSTSYVPQRTLTDIRDNITYQVRKLADGKCWMTQNLKFNGTTLNSTTSNVNPVYTESNPLTISWKDLSTDDETNPRNRSTGNGVRGYWYNYVGTTALTVKSGNTVNPTYDICPQNWKLPSRTDFSGVTSLKATWSPAVGGIVTQAQGKWQQGYESSGSKYWSSTLNGGSSVYILKYDGSSLTVTTGTRYDGRYVRCIAKY